MTPKQKRNAIQRKKWRRQEELAVRAVRDYAAKRLSDFNFDQRSRILRAAFELGV